MSAHSNKKIVQHVENSAVLLDKMHALTQNLQTRLFECFEKNMGTPLPSVVMARVRQIDCSLCYATDASVDEYVTGARDLLKAGFGGDKLQLVDRALDFVAVLARKIIGSGAVKIGVHSTGGQVEDFVAACMSVVEQAKASDWATQTDFIVASYALVVWKPAPVMATRLTAAPLLKAASIRLGAPIPAQLAEAAYRFEPL
jgi:hypothetical protein